MAFDNNERLQEFFILVGDRLAPVNKAWWYLLVLSLIFVIPGYFIAKSIFVTALVGTYNGPEVIYTSVEKEPLQILDSKIFALPNNTYSGYVKLKNINLEWGISRLEYTAEFKTTGGTVVNSYNMTTFVLPASEKLIVLPSFPSTTAPTKLDFALGKSQFIHKPELAVNFDTERTSLSNMANGLIVTSAFKNLTPFVIRQVELPVAVYNSANQIVAVNFTYINDVKSNETRTFQYSWPGQVTGAVRAEINPEVNIFDRDILTTEAGVSPFNNIDRPE